MSDIVGILRRIIDKEFIFAVLVLVCLILVASYGLATGQFVVGTVVSLLAALFLILYKSRIDTRSDARSIVRVEDTIVNEVTKLREEIQHNNKLPAASAAPAVDFTPFVNALSGAAGIFVVQNSRIVYINDYITQIAGYAPAELYAKGEEFLDIIHPDDRDTVRQQMMFKLSGATKGVKDQYQVRGLPKFGGERDILLQSHTCEWHGQPAIVGIFMDVTQHNTKLETFSAHAKQREIFDTADALVIALDREGIVKLVNKAVTDVLRCEKDDIIGHNWFDFCVSAETREACRTIFYELVAGRNGRFANFESSLVSSRGDEIWVAWLTSLTRDERNRINGVFRTGRILTGNALETAKATATATKLVEAIRLEKRQPAKPLIVKNNGEITVEALKTELPAPSG